MSDRILKEDSFVLKKADGHPKQAQANALIKLYVKGERFTAIKFWDALGGNIKNVPNMLKRAADAGLCRLVAGNTWERV